jgi:hypothetical protein
MDGHALAGTRALKSLSEQLVLRSATEDCR